MSNKDIFIRQVRSRSAEHRRAMEVLGRENLTGQMVSVLRQELDSMVRVIYLLSQDINRRNDLIDASVCGVVWTRHGSKLRLTDKEMVDISSKFYGWTKSVYKFGCAFIHLSNLHDYNDRDPFVQISEDERRDIISHCRQYHGGPSPDAETFAGIVPYIPQIFQKVSENLECYIDALEEDELTAHHLI